MLLFLKPNNNTSYIGVPGSGRGPVGAAPRSVPRGAAVADAPVLVVSVNASRPKGSVR